MAAQETLTLQDEENQATDSKGEGELFNCKSKLKSTTIITSGFAKANSSPSQNDIWTLENWSL